MKSFKQNSDEIEYFIEFIEEDLENIKRVKDFLDKKNIEAEFEIHPKAETVKESSSYSPIKKEQIIKTLIFKTENHLVGVLCPGNSRVDENKLEKLTNSSIDMAEPKEIAEKTNYIVGGVSPFDLDIPLFIDSSLLEHDEVRPAAGSRVVGVCIHPQQLKEAINATEAEIAE